ncbi:MAG: S9 family peptidase [Opitutaceae bacterium]|nr:S9 family peptidase [Opitutaceae bacterium]
MKTHRGLAALLVSAILSLGLSAAERVRRPISHEDVWLMKRVGIPVPSPDGRQVVVAVTEPAYDPKAQASDLWLVALDGVTPVRQITFSKQAESGMSWSPDSRKLAFTTTREGDEVSQVYVLDLAAGGEAERVTSLSTGASAPKWSPDGNWLLFVSNVYPGAADDDANRKAAQERKDRKFSARAYEGFPPRFWDKWLDDRKPHPFVQEAKAGAVARDLLAGTRLAEHPGFGGTRASEGETLEAVWTPDSQAVVLVASQNRHQAAFAETYTQLFQVELAGGEPRQLTSDTRGYTQPAFSPDGRTLLALSTANDPGEIYSVARLSAMAWPAAGAPQLLTAGFDRAVSRFAMPADSGRIYFTCEHAGREKLYSLARAGGEVRPEPSPDTGVIGGLAAGGQALVGTWDSAVNPPEVYAFTGAPRALTAFNTARAAQIDWLPPEHFDFRAKDGLMIHSMLVKPPGFDPTRKYPLFLVIHGGPANMWRDSFGLRWNYHLLARPGYVVLLTDYKGSTGYGEAFSRAIKLDPLKGPADELNEAVDEAIRRFSFVDGKRLAAGGASYGGHLANWLQATTTRYKAIISHAGQADLMMQWGTSDSIFGREVATGSPIWGDSRIWREQSPALQAGNHARGHGFKTPILITVGELDYRVPVNNAYMWFTLNQRLQVPSRLIVFPDENHWVLKGENSRYWYAEVHAWLRQNL